MSGNRTLELSRKHFIDPQLRAPNVREVQVSLDLLAPIIALAPVIQQIKQQTERLTLPGGLNMEVLHPSYWSSDLLWIAADDEATYRYFETLFHALGVAEHVSDNIEFDREIRLYNAMFVSRSSCSDHFWHYDWTHSNNDGFTFLTPISENCGDIALAYRDIRNDVRSYRYCMGKGIMFADFFNHSTAPGKSDKPAVLLALQFGTDRMERWSEMLSSNYQGGFHCRPDGVFVRTTKYREELA
jgi:hypothetical protein